MKKMVLSGINLLEGGPLSIYYDCLNTIIAMRLYNEYHITAFVHKKELFVKYEEKIEIIELPKSRKNYIYRLYYEYFYFSYYSKQRDIDIWISLHDITPKVYAKKRYTYCHNPSPFMDDSLKRIKNIRFGFTYILFAYFYKFLYGINIKNATAIIVQQDWMRNEFVKMYDVKKVVVARPVTENRVPINNVPSKDKIIFVFASYPRFFKNFEQICEACKRVDDSTFEVWLTIDGSENNYAKSIYKKYSSVKAIKWKGLQTREEVFRWYEVSNALIFPSKLETWGLPISEYKNTGKDILLIDLPYAHETLGEYEKVMFFAKDSPDSLANCMKMVIESKQNYNSQKEKKIQEPYANDWTELLQMICK